MKVSTNAHEMERHLIALHRLMLAGAGDSEQADRIRDAMDFVDARLDARERGLLANLSSDLYMIEGEEDTLTLHETSGPRSTREDLAEAFASGRWEETLDVLRTQSVVQSRERIASMRARCWRELGFAEGARCFEEYARSLGAATRTFGSTTRFGIALTLAPASAARDIGLAWGEGLLWLAGEPMWFMGDKNDPKPIDHTWIDLLEFLADSWVRLSTEESYPFRLTPTTPMELRRAAESRWELLSLSRRLEEDETLRRFEHYHDLARGMKGANLPSLFLMREGDVMWVCSNEHSLRIPFRELFEVLSRCGDFLAAHISESVAPRAREVWKKWSARFDVDQTQVLSYRLGMNATAVSTLEANLRRRAKVELSSASLWELPQNDVFADTELVAAARMTFGNVGSFDIHAMVLARVRDVPLGNTPKLDALAEEATALVDRSKEPYAQGYDAARWLRTKLGTPAGRVDPQGLLAQWGVRLVDFEVPSNRLDAVACWGPRHGPAVLLNRRGAHAKSVRGARSTLAHEIGHLLLDRQGSLPLAEVLGGNVPEMPEKRARAFAAEFLLPQSVVESAIQGSDIAEAVQRLREEYGVSNQIVGWQLTNGMAWFELNDEERNYVEDLTRATMTWGSDVADE